ncbi:MAG: hypothetical protein IJ318_03790, partial [Clostridia bacterium]|nr:hypothetical protein [Clostridia bacterium]
VAPIVITLAITNTSKFDIVASVTSATATSPVAIESPTEDVKITQNSTESLTFTLTLTSTANGVTPSSDNVNISLHLEKYVSPFYVADNKLFVNMGTDPDTGNPIRWYAIAKDNAGTFETLKSTQVTSVEAGTYVFISEYILENSTGGDTIFFNSSRTAENNYGANYGGSTIQTYINGTGAGSMDARYNFSSSEIWGTIELKDCGSETVTDSDAGSDVTIPATNDQTLWLLSYSEYNSWFGNDDSCGIGYLLNNASSAAYWWLRSAGKIYSIDDDMSDVWCVDRGGRMECNHASVYEEYGVRPAFQITIN